MPLLKDMRPGESARVTKVNGTGALRQHFLDMGMIPGTEVTVVKLAPMGDPMELRLHGYELTLRVADAGEIEVSRISEKKEPIRAKVTRSKTDHPGLGEGGRFHAKGDGDPLPDGTVMRFALVGNQNSGKTTLFNRLTGARQHVGNFPGVTVDRKDGAIKGYPDTIITDLPGIYSMSPYSSEEIVSRSFVLDEKPHAVINIVDSTNIERNMYLTMQLLEMDIPMVVALNMMDELTSNGGGIDINIMEQRLGVPVVPISAAKNEGVDELVEHAVHIAHYRERPVEQDFCGKNINGGAVHRCIHGIRHLIEDHAEKAGIPLRFAASKVIEGDELVISALGLDENERDAIEHIVLQMEKESGLDRSAAIADMRYRFIMELCGAAVTKPTESREHLRSRRIDKLLTGKFTAVPMFILIMGLISWLTFGVIGAWLQDLLASGIDRLTALVDEALTDAEVNDVLHGLIVDGIFTGVGSVLSFLPVIITLFFFLSMLEDSGYIARVAFFMDKMLRRIGLSGRSIVPMLIGFGCSVPAVMSTRTLSSERDRRMTILLTPFMSCTAKMPIYSFFVEAFFPDIGWLIIIGLYLLGIILGLLAAVLYKGVLFRGEPVPFVMELPNYRLPGAGNVVRLMWEKAKDFLQRAFSVILVATVLIWFLKNFDLHMTLTADPEKSILAAIAGIFSPVMQPIGLGDWRILVSLITGFMAKESVVSSFGVLFPDSASMAALTSLTVVCMLVFSLLYTPCVAAIAAIKRELGVKWAAAVAVWQCAVAWLAALLVHAIGMMIGAG
ncbi:MAG: ferrous iron transport protein B [Ruminiclostridium sp.]|nr:ferrous iron transport protein B [Ruminiclostridium sp.]